MEEKAGAQMAEMGAIAFSPEMMAELDFLHLPKPDAAAAAALEEEIVLDPSRLEKEAVEQAEISEAMEGMGRSLEPVEAAVGYEKLVEAIRITLMAAMVMLGVLISECT